MQYVLFYVWLLSLVVMALRHPVLLLESVVHFQENILADTVFPCDCSGFCLRLPISFTDISDPGACHGLLSSILLSHSPFSCSCESELRKKHFGP